jgi:hypothetical protein
MFPGRKLVIVSASIALLLAYLMWAVVVGYPFARRILRTDPDADRREPALAVSA